MIATILFALLIQAKPFHDIALPAGEDRLNWDPMDVREEAREKLQKDPSNPEALRLKTKAEIALGMYGEAVWTARQDPSLALLEAAAEKRNALAAKLAMWERQAPIVCAQLLDGRIAAIYGEWLNPHGAKVDDDAPTEYGDQYRNVRLKVFRKGKFDVKKTWESPLLSVSSYSPNECSVSEVGLYVADVTGDGQDDIIVALSYYGADYEPSSVYVFQQSGKTWKQIAHGTGTVFMSMVDSKGYGKYQIIGSHEIGDESSDPGPSHAEQPRWIDIWEYSNGRYRTIPSHHPEVYHELAKEIWNVASEYPACWDLWENLAEAQLACGERGKAIYFYGREVQEIRRSMVHPPYGMEKREWPRERRRLRKELVRVRGIRSRLIKSHPLHSATLKA